MNSCKNITKDYTLLNNISLHILILFTILSSLFLFYISKIEYDTVNNEITNFINETKITNDFLKYFPNDNIFVEFIKKNKTKVLDATIKDLKQTKNQLSEEINLKIKEEICIIIGFLILIVIIVNIIPIKFFNYCNNGILTILGELIVVFIFIGIIEFLFFEYIAQKYIPVQPSLLVKAFKNRCLEILKNNKENF